MVARRDERIARMALGSANPGGRLKSGDAAPQWIETIAVSDIDPDPDQPRRHFDPVKLAELGQSLQSVGQLQPVILIRTDKRYRLHVGERRWRAAQLVGLATVRAIVLGHPLEVRAARIAQVVENEQRDDLTTTELIDAVRALHADGLKSIEIAAALSKSKSRISELSALAEAPVELLAIADRIGADLSYRLLARWRDEPVAALDFLAHMPPEHISRVTIATIGQPVFSQDPAEARSLAADRPLDQPGAGKGASPRHIASASRPTVEHSPDPNGASSTPIVSSVPTTIGALFVEHGEYGQGMVVFGVDTPPDHLAISFDGGDPNIFHKADIRLIRTVRSLGGHA